MIIKKEDILTITLTEKINNDFSVKKIVKLFKPAGVLFEEIYDASSNNFLYFSVQTINEQGKIENTKSFDGSTQESFFDAVRYFEKLITERIPEQEEKDYESVGTFTYFADKKAGILMTNNKTYELVSKDIEKVYTPETKDSYGMLDFFLTDEKRFDEVKMRYSLVINGEKTKLIVKSL